MSRSTQYIGLNDYAIAFVKKAKNVIEYEMTSGMFGESVTGKIYEFPVPSGPNKSLKYIEVVQCEPWSSGPMIFTCLKEVLEKESGDIIESEQGEELFRWMSDPSLNEEYDSKTGRIKFS